MKRICVALAVAAAASLLAAPAGAGAAKPYCGITWGSKAKSAGGLAISSARVRDARAGRHKCFDRLVIDLTGSAKAPYDIEYVDEVTSQGSGLPVEVDGGARLAVVLRAPAYDLRANPTYDGSTPSVAGFRTFREVKYDTSFEGVTQFALGVRARLPFRVIRLSSPNRVAVDVAHRWSASPVGG